MEEKPATWQCVFCGSEAVKDGDIYRCTDGNCGNQFTMDDYWKEQDGQQEGQDMTEKELQRKFVFIIERAELKTGKQDSYWAIETTDKQKLNCFQELDTAPQKGAQWAANIKESTSRGTTYRNLVDMVLISAPGDETGRMQNSAPLPAPAPERAAQAAQGAPKGKSGKEYQSADGKVKIDSAYVVKISGKDFITYNGLLKAAHANGLYRLEVMNFEYDVERRTAWCQVRACFNKIGDGKPFVGSYDGIGSANPANCASGVGSKHLAEMSQTRGISRALRFALNIDMVCSTELAPEDKEDKK